MANERMLLTALCAAVDAQVVWAAGARFDLKCPAEQLKLTELIDVCGPFLCTVGVSGCGQQATYVMDPNTKQRAAKSPEIRRQDAKTPRRQGNSEILASWRLGGSLGLGKQRPVAFYSR